jgi:hypothetical protein
MRASALDTRHGPGARSALGAILIGLLSALLAVGALLSSIAGASERAAGSRAQPTPPRAPTPAHATSPRSTLPCSRPARELHVKPGPPHP